MFEAKQRWVPFLPRFSEILPRSLGIFWIFRDFVKIFSISKLVGGALAPPAPPPPTPLLSEDLRFEHEVAKLVSCPGVT